MVLIASSGPPAQAAPRKRARVYSKSVLVVSFDGKRVLYRRDAGKRRSIASLTKLMAALVLIDRKLRLDGVNTITQGDTRVAAGGARSRLKRGMKVRNRDLLYAALLASDNRAIPALGRAVGLSPGQLVGEMNRRARRMGLHRTYFADPVGIDIRNVSTSFEIAKIVRQAVLHPVLQHVLRTRNYFFRPVWPRRYAINYHNTNALVHRAPYPVYGGKTGYNHRAGYCFAGAMRLPGYGAVLVVFLGSRSKTSRFSDFYAIARLLRSRRPRVRTRVARRSRRSSRRSVRRPPRRRTVVADGQD